VSFLISTPETGVDSIALTYSLLDPIMTVMRPVTAFATALFAGVVENVTGRESTAAEAQPPRAEELQPRVSGLGRLRDGLRFAFNDLMNDVAGWFVLGVALAGVITALVPESFVSAHLGAGLIAYLTMLAVALPLYVCASMSTPLAAALIMKGLSPGAALVFLMAGPATNAATMTMVAGMLGRRTFVVYLGSIVVCTLAFAFLTDALYAALGTSAQATAGASAAEVFPQWLEWAAAGVLALLVARALWQTYITEPREAEGGAVPSTRPASGCCAAEEPAGCT
jgi:uncharacterized membrane protein YraQ (UPF0718 family)